jgi:hypothetical protein
MTEHRTLPSQTERVCLERGNRSHKQTHRRVGRWIERRSRWYHATNVGRTVLSPACKRRSNGETNHNQKKKKKKKKTRPAQCGEEKNPQTLRGLRMQRLPAWDHPESNHSCYTQRCSCGEPKPKAAARASPFAAAKTHIRLSVCLYLTPDHRTQVRCLFGCSNREVRYSAV